MISARLFIVHGGVGKKKKKKRKGYLEIHPDTDF